MKAQKPCEYCGESLTDVSCELCGALVCSKHNKKYGCEVCKGKIEVEEG